MRIAFIPKPDYGSLIHRTAIMMSLLTGVALAGTPQAIQVQVEPPWHISTDLDLDSRPGISPEAVVPVSRLSSLIPHLIYPIIEAIVEKGYPAYPAIYTSCLQLSRDFSSKAMIEHYLRREPAEQKRYLTLIPIIYRARVVRRSLMRSSEMEIRFRLEVYQMSGQGGLGRILLGKDLSIPFTVGEQVSWDDITRTLPVIERRISGLAEWDTLAAQLPGLSGGLLKRFQGPVDSTVSEEKTRLYFEQSEMISNLQEDRLRISKANFRCLGKSGRTMNDLAFPFMADEQWPLFLYAYILKPDGKVIPISGDEAHIEQSPDALPSKIYDWSRVYVVNLPGLEPGCIVTYAVRFQGRSTDTVWATEKRVRRRLSPVLAKDIAILPVNGERYQIGVWAEAGDTVRFAAHHAVQSIPENLPMGAVNLFWVAGKGEVTGKGHNERENDPFHPIVRVSNQEDWNHLLKSVRDSVYSRLPEVKAIRPRPGRGAVETLVMGTHKFIHDSLRYVSRSFGERAYVPAFPDSVLRDRMGDCKDFSVLMISNLRRQGVEAYPALMNARFPRNLFPGPPSFDATDHMIVQIPGFGLWIDPTAGVTPPGVLPFHLAGAEALVLYPDSIAVRELPRNTDDAYSGTTSYQCAEKDDDLVCQKRTVFSKTDSWDWRSYLKEFPREKWPEVLHPVDWNSAGRMSETETRVRNVDEDRENLEVIRIFTGHHAISHVGAKTVIRFPETPFRNLFRITETRDKASPLVLSNPILQTVDILLSGRQSIQWPGFESSQKPGASIKAWKTAPNAIHFSISIRAGEVRTEDRQDLEADLERYKDFFSALWLAG